MDSSKKATHTNIIGFDEVAALTQQGQRKKASKKRTAGSRSAATKTRPAKSAGSQTTAGNTQAKPPSKKTAGPPKPAKPEVAASSTKIKSKRELVPNESSDSRVFEGYGIRIPLYDNNGERKESARLSSALCARNRDQLLDIVEEYAGSDKRKQFINEKQTKAYIADWIEKAESLALGPNPRSELQWSSSEDEASSGTDPDPEPTNAQIHSQGKRKRDDASSPTQDSPQTTKKQKTQQADEQQAQQADPEDIVEETTQDIPQASQNRTFRTKADAERLLNLVQFMNDAKLFPDFQYDTETSRVVHLPEKGEDRVITASWQTKKGVISDKRPPTLHDTPISLDRSQRKPPSRPVEPPFLKAGNHGRHGDFETDPDRRTGRGHQVTLENEIAHAKYLHTRGTIFKAYPEYPRTASGEPVDPATKESWRANERFAAAFQAQYPGYPVNHLWPCGCEKLRYASEDEESEEE